MNYLETIIKQKRSDLAKLDKTVEKQIKNLCFQLLNKEVKTGRSFSEAIVKEKFSVIAEIKRSSPSKGILKEKIDPSILALKYSQGGAAAISVLTDSRYFGGSLDDLKEVSVSLEQQNASVPTLRKDFIIHEIQLFEAVLAGASAVLLIANVLQNDLKKMSDLAANLGLESLIEVHDESDLILALKANAKIIGVNNRNLKTFETNLKKSEMLYPLIPKNVITVSESGIFTVQDAKTMKNIGYQAILVGEALVKSDNPSGLIAKMKE